MKLSEITRALDTACPGSMAADWDNVGLHVGDTDAEIRRIMVALDADLPTIEHAIDAEIGLLVTHHPLFRQPPTRMTMQDPDGRRVSLAVRAGLAVYSLHTNFDAIPGGVSDVLADRLGLRDTRVLSTVGSLRKIVVFVPEEHVEAVFAAMSDAGAGRIGAYRACSFRVAGKGTFTAPADSHPALGKAGRANVVDEVRLETTSPAERLEAIIGAMIGAHPYEEIAYDVYTLDASRSDIGLGRLGINPEPATLEQFAAVCAKRLGTATVKYAGPPDTRIVRVAVCGGSGGGLIEASVASLADVLVSGDLRYHDAQKALALGLALVDAGHDGTEAPAVERLAQLVKASLAALGYTGDIIGYETTGLWKPVGGDIGQAG